MKNFYRSKFAILILLSTITSCTQNPFIDNEVLKIHTITKIQVDSDNNIIRRCFYKEFNSSGILIKFIEYNEDGRYVVHNYTQISPNLTEEKLFYYRSNSMLDSQLLNYNYYAPNNKIDRIVTLDPLGDTTKVQLFTYDSLGNVSVVTEHIPSSNIEVKTNYFYTYNERGEILKILIQNQTSARLEEFSYQPNKSTINRSIYNSFGELQEVITIIYNKSGLIISEIYTSNTGSLLRKYRYEYTFYN